MFNYLIMNTNNGKRYVKPGHVTHTMYDTARGAKIACTRLNKEWATSCFVVMTNEQFEYYYPVKMKKVKNLMSGIEIEIAEDTPLCCDPSSETYWSA
jgi:hypothetical protein